MSAVDIGAIRDALTIEQLLESRGGGRLRRGRGPCPVCGTSERSTAFSVRDGRFRCFACNEHGDVVDLVAKLDQVPLREAIRRSAALAGIAPGAHPVQIHPRPKSAWQIAREERDAAWWRFFAALRAREQAAAQYEASIRRFGTRHGLSIYVGRVLAEAYDRELAAEHAYDCAIEVQS